MIKINSFWLGNSLSQLEILSIKSHIKVGHYYNLWTYDNLDNVPLGVNIKDAREILPAEKIFCYQIGEGKGSFSAFSNIFRYKLLEKKDGWWSDMDVIVLKKFDFFEDSVFASEINRNGYSSPTTCVIKMDKSIAAKCYNESCIYDQNKLKWGTIGPKLLTKEIFKLNNMSKYVQLPHVFCPINWFDSEKDPLIQKNIDISKSYAVHMWHEMWRRKGIDKNGNYNQNCLFEKLKNAILCS